MTNENKPDTESPEAHRIAVLILRHPEDKNTIWPDDFEIEAENRNDIGAAYKMLIANRIIMKTGEFRASTLPSHNGRTIFCYRTLDPFKASTFLVRYGNLSPKKEPQMEFAL